jgi:DNA repair protein RecO (recombination protein O)
VKGVNMIEHTKGIVLHQIKYTDSGIVVQFYTRKSGRQSFLVHSSRNKKAGKHNVFFQPMFILDLISYNRETRSLQTLKEYSVSFVPADIHSNIMKSSVAIFLGEVLTSVLREETPNEELFDFLEDSIKYFDSCREGYANFHIAFLAGLSSYLGFEPVKRTSENEIYFDMLEGEFTNHPPAHGNYAGKDISKVLASFFSSSYEEIVKIPLNGSMRNEILETIVHFYSIHLPGLKKIKSLEILKEVFN